MRLIEYVKWLSIFQNNFRSHWNINIEFERKHGLCSSCKSHSSNSNAWYIISFEKCQNCVYPNLVWAIISFAASKLISLHSLDTPQPKHHMTSPTQQHIVGADVSWMRDIFSVLNWIYTFDGKFHKRDKKANNQKWLKIIRFFLFLLNKIFRRKSAFHISQMLW